MKVLNILLLFVITVVSVTAQNTSPAFEVTSVKRNVSNSGSSSTGMRTGRFIATNVTLSQLVRDAYGIQEFQIASQPGWFDTERFDVEAIMAAGAKPEDAQLMLQALLAERFKLAFRREQRPAGVYALVVAKDGPKLTKADPSKCSNSSGCGLNASPTQIVGTSVSMPQLAFRLWNREELPLKLWLSTERKGPPKTDSLN